MHPSVVGVCMHYKGLKRVISEAINFVHGKVISKLLTSNGTLVEMRLKEEGSISLVCLYD